MNLMQRLLPKANRSLKANAGFSLIEILIALTLLGLAGTFVAGKIFKQFHEGRVKSARIHMNQVKARLQEFRRICGFYPSSLEGLLTKPSDGPRECVDYPEGGFLQDDDLPIDPWDNDYFYQSTDNGRKFTLYSFGGDGQEGGEAEDADVFPKKKRKRRN